MIPILLSILLLSNKITSTCSTGTLKCNATTDPPISQICDFKNGYLLNSSKDMCVVFKLPGCLLPTFSQETALCFQCDNGKVYDATSLKCIDVAKENLVNNCLRYDSQSSLCSECQKHFWLTVNTCESVSDSQQIANCSLYAALGACGTCESGFRLVQDNKCESFEPVPGCKFHTDRQCTSCVEGYHYAPNVHHQLPLSDVLKQEILTDKLTDAWWTSHALHSPVCLKREILNCKEFLTFDTCKTCEPNHFLTPAALCQQNPDVLFPHCLIYRDQSSCKRCGGPYYLSKDDPPACVAAVVVEHCKQYETNRDHCLICEEHFWFDQPNNVCRLRTVESVDFCIGLDDFSDECLGCEEGLSLTKDVAKCLPDLKDCLNQSQGMDQDSLAHSCKQCDEEFYLSDGLCLKRDVKHCDSFLVNQNECQVCTDDYFLYKGECEKQNIDFCAIYLPNLNECFRCEGHRFASYGNCFNTDVLNCETFKSNSNVCLICEKGFYLSEKYCKKTSVDNCVKFEKNSNLCEECLPGYFKDNEECNRNGIPHCAEYVPGANRCSDCSIGFFLDGDKCSSVSVDNCLEYSPNVNTCVTCSQNRFLEDSQCKLKNVPGCIEYLADSDTCSTCAPNFIKSGDSCISRSQSNCIQFKDESAICEICAQGFWMEEVSGNMVCQLQNVTGCVVYVEDSAQCSRCAQGHWKESPVKCTIFRTDIDNCIDFSVENGECSVCAQNYWLVDNSCVAADIENCIKYQTESPGCSDCAAGFYPNGDKLSCLAFDGSNCVQFNQTSGACIECAKGYRISGDDCAKLEIRGCIEFDLIKAECLTCQKDRYLSNGACLSRKVLQCIEYDGESDTCTLCALGYYLDVSNICIEQKVPNCIEYDEDKGTCKTCAFGYLNQSTQCEAFDTTVCLKFDLSGDCIECPKDKYMDSTVCKLRDRKHCVEYEGDTNDCQTCQDGFYLTASKFCSRQAIDHCVDYTPNLNTCIRCRAGAAKVGSVCQIQDVANCIEYNNDLPTCKTCMAGFHFVNASTCTQNNRTGCVLYTPNTNTCIACSANYHLTSPTCTENTVANCISFDSAGVCTLCAQGYHQLSGTDCSKENITDCVEYTSNTVCKTCAQGKYWDQTSNAGSGACVVWDITHCIESSASEKKCLTCQTGKHPTSSGTVCSDVSVSHCLQYTPNSNDCLKCGANTYLKSSSECATQDLSNCIEFTPNTNNCITCAVGFYASANSCAPQSIANCIEHTFNLNTCLTCSTGYFSNQTSCSRQTDVANCRKYTVNSGKCETCAPGYYLAEPTQCSPQLLSNCLEYTDNANICTKCALMYLPQNEVCEEQTMIDNCLEYSADYTTCSVCGNRFFSDNTSTCQPMTKSNCMIQEPNLDSCQKCDPNYFNNTGTCGTQSIADCSVYVENENKCYTCDATFYSNDDGVTCISPRTTIASCVVYSSDTRGMKCSQCDSLMYPSGTPVGSACSDITDLANCFSSSGTTDSCSNCKPTFFKNSSTFLCSEDRTPDFAEKNCESNSLTSDSRRCTTCKSGYLVKNGFKLVKKASFLTDNNCVKVHYDTGKCSQCKEFYQLKTDGTCDGPKAWVYDMNCSQKEEHNTTDFTVNSSCTKCYDPEFLYLVGGRCLYRGDIPMYDTGCNVWNLNSNFCKICNKGTENFKETKNVDSQRGSKSSITNCVLTTGSKCTTCVPGMVPDLDNRICRFYDSEKKAVAKRCFKTDFDNRGPILKNSGIVKNCYVYMQVTHSDIGCTKCESGYAGIVPDFRSSGTKPYAFSRTKDNMVQADDVVSTFIKCLPDQEVYLRSTSYIDKITGNSTCVIGYMHDPSKPGFACLKCSPDYFGKIGLATHYADGEVIGSNVPSIVDCKPNVNLAMSKTHRGMFFSNHQNIGEHLQRSTYAYWDSCPSGMQPVYMLVTSLDNMTMSLSTKKQTNGNPLDVVYCVPETHLTVLPGCQIYSLSAELAEDLNQTFDAPTADFTAKTTCMACQPGFQRKKSNNECEDKTSHCDLQVSDWLGGCMKPNNGFTFDKDAPFGIPESATANEMGCKVQSAAATKECWMCHEGWMWLESRSKCVQAYTSENCYGRIGGGFYQSELFTGNTEFMMNSFANMVWHRWENDLAENFMQNFVREGCYNGPSQGYFSTSSSSKYDCSSTSVVSTITNCTQYTPAGNFTKCLECEAGFIPKDNNGPADTCISDSLYSNCLRVHSASVCEVCADGFYRPDGTSKSCLSKNCKIYDPSSSNNCLVCDDNKVLDGTIKTRCSPVDTTSDCLNFSPRYGVCVKCKVSTQFPFNSFKKSKLPDNSYAITEFDVVECREYSWTGTGYDSYEQTYGYFMDTFRNYNFTFYNSFLALETPDIIDRLTRDGLGSGHIDSSLCLPIATKTVTNCARYGLYFCESCDDGYVMNVTNGCDLISNTVANCKTSIMDDVTLKCLICNDDYFPDVVALATSCTLRDKSSAANCLSPEVDKDECLVCHQGTYLDVPNTQCIANTAIGCISKSIIENKCELCSSNQFVDGANNDDCTAYSTAINCLAFKPDADECDTCNAGYIKDGIVCTKTTATNCKTFKPNSNECGTCDTNFTPTGSTCTPKTKASCLTRSTTDDTCASCTNSFYLSSGVCEAKLGYDCLTPYTDSDPANKAKCATCSVNYVAGTAPTDCVKKTKTHCKTYDSSEDKCVNCSEHFTLDTDGNCVLKPAGVCLTNTTSTTTADAAKCLTCHTGFSKTGDTCDTFTVAKCLTRKDDADECATCSTQFMPSGTSCGLKTSSMCLAFDPSSDSCGTCGPNQFVSGTDCVDTTGTDCSAFNYTTGKCTSCVLGFVLNPSTFICEKNTAANCKIYVLDKHKCETCQSPFKFDESKSNCIKKSSANCKTWTDDSDTDQCADCALGFISDPISGSCLTTRATDCFSFKAGLHQCDTCSRIYILNQDTKSCELREALNCETYASGNLDICQTCKTGTVQNSETRWCDPNSAMSCRSFKIGEHQCSTCSELFTLSSNGQCSANLASDCLTLDSAAPGCNTCFSARYVKTGQQCLLKDRLNCKTFHPTLNQCQTCSDLFLKAADHSCVPRTAEKCEEFTTNDVDACASCKIGFYKDGDTCKTNTGVDCLTFNTASNGCGSCGGMFILDGLNCVRHDSALCKSYNNSESKCADCEAGFKLSTNAKSCDPLVAFDCLKISSTSNQCVTCSQISYLNLGGCVSNPGKLCKEYNTTDPGCLTCEEGFYSDSNDDCKPINRQNCLTYETNKNECKTCAPGFYLDQDDKHCKTNDGLQCLALNTLEDGCLSCPSNFFRNGENCQIKSADNCLSFKTEDTSNQCLQCGSMYVKDNLDHTCKPNTALNCKSFDLGQNKCNECSKSFFKDGNGECVPADAEHCEELEDSLNQCKSCVTGWVFDQEGKKCIPNQAELCLEFKSDIHKCQSCKTGAWMDSVDGDCKIYTAENCITYAEDKDECLYCEDSFYLLENPTGQDICVQNTAKQCEKYSRTENNCTACKAGYFIDSDNGTECVPSTATHCETYHRNLNQCTSCKDGYLTVIETEVVKCRAYTAMNCQSFKKSQDKCLICRPGTYARVNANDNSIDCVERTLTSCVDFLPEQDGCKKCPDTHHVDISNACKELSKVKHCEIYALDKDQCSECQLGYYKNPAQNECLQNPSGIANCSVYLNEHRCWKCDGSTFLDLSTNHCLSVLQAVDKCASYFDSTHCKECLTGFLLEGNQCFQITVENCVLLKSHDKCLTCADNFILDVQKGVCTASNIANCVTISRNQDGPMCTQCQPQYLLSSDFKSCTSPAVPVTNCVDYKSEKECRECSDGFLLSKDKASCLEMTILSHSFCTRGLELNDLVCDRCHHGFRRNVEGKCDLLEPSKCVLVDQKTEKCLLCAPGTYMDQKESCVGTPSDLKLLGNDTRLATVKILDELRLLVVLLALALSLF